MEIRFLGGIRSGPYEIGAYVLAAVATYSFPRFELKGRFFREQIVPIHPPERSALGKEQWVGVFAVQDSKVAQHLTAADPKTGAQVVSSRAGESSG